ncbi:Protein-tyrosine phosphatase, receptor/non-receptor type domain and Protein-tyrosine/Dual specificity phosphatase domain and Protein-tyrosine phosphatase, catalytic domain-containing protein [Strongyloides ratti]|uniref:Protein-tyrosine phosphatase, receptor/non-receptor type domain and Protein-tyrosine/Dual specificity phosphatase domain and Protein-tyrosine phosphatase, catalytic domain-containing protein n=1 Tax=Strongyloides ratti TaxID=34506 RepID=A0A090L3R4_STRRB|nr:Protein-tyrosine phosphatase, receptor/non-receptor type domain and Protein-tyrosine/Dual specificity phosphatase domain and Protein-tyrosine phosphatase, catalytic domain-containing protein [Strongyloides ratti]CEF64461.1 Protein-tyrosine phosphatase, receptor/non-receptor type domain and Protein-tyrosine/Dual specificity phosphatase domain and Protein-tyrosine phosphatase, catalytic domain-containing protein [Strongyloides ratti]
MENLKTNLSKKIKRSLKIKGKRTQIPNVIDLKDNINGNNPLTETFNNNLIAFVKNTCEIGVVNIIKEFHELQLYEKKHIKNHKAFDSNSSKCRYKDILCYDDSRVILQCKSNRFVENDFIHANYMNSKKENLSCVCTQGPLQNTIYDFWIMIWQLKSRSIIMLCEIFECGKKKCEQYWPLNSNENIKINNLTIVFLGKHFVYKNIVKTYLRIIIDGKERIIFHYQYLDWPDRGVPSNYLLCLNLIRLATKTRPVVIHCSAGIGRTGTIVCLDDMISKLSTSEKCLRIKHILLEKREFRYGIVQTEIQYLFLHRVLISLALDKKIISEEEVAQFIQQYDAVLNKIIDPLPIKKIEQEEEVTKKANIKQHGLLKLKLGETKKIENDSLTKTQISLETFSKPIDKTQGDELIRRNEYLKTYITQKKKKEKKKIVKTDTNSDTTIATT